MNNQEFVCDPVLAMKLFIHVDMRFASVGVAITLIITIASAIPTITCIAWHDMHGIRHRKETSLPEAKCGGGNLGITVQSPDRKL